MTEMKEYSVRSEIRYLAGHYHVPQIHTINFYSLLVSEGLHKCAVKSLMKYTYIFLKNYIFNMKEAN